MPRMGLILPYAVEDSDRKKPFDPRMEVAATVCLAEARRKKGGILGSPEKISFISKVHYPFWAVPWEEESLILDGLGFFPYTVEHMKTPDIESFTEDIKENTSVRKLYQNSLRKHAQTFKNFTSSAKKSMDTVISNESLLFAISEFIKQGSVQKKEPPIPFVLIPPKLDEKTAKGKAEKLMNYWRKIQSEIKGLKYAVNFLDEETEFHAKMILREIEQIREEYKKQILALKPVVEERTEDLIKERDDKIEKLGKTAEKELKALLKKRDTYEKELQKLELTKSGYQQRRDARKREDDKEGASLWNRRMKSSEKEISEVEKRNRSIIELMERTRRQSDDEIKALNEHYQTAIDEERKRILDLEALLNSETEAKQTEIEELRSETASMIKQIERLMEQKISHAVELEELTIPWKGEGVTLICVPLYLIRYENEEETRYDVQPPTVAEDYEGIIKKIEKAILSFSLEYRINLFLHSRSKALKETLASVFVEKTRKNESFEKLVYTLGYSNNLLKRSDFAQTLAAGLEELEKEGWIKSEEKDSILKTYAPPTETLGVAEGEHEC